MNLKVGQKLSNKDLVELLGSETQKKSFNKNKRLATRSKDSLITELNRYCEFEEGYEGRKKIYEITEVFDGVKPRVDGNANNGNKIYADVLDLVNSDILKKGDQWLSVGKALQLAYLVNENYQVARRDIPNTALALGIEEKFIYTFYNDQHQRLKNIYESSLNRLQKKSLIKWNKIVIVNAIDIEKNKVGGARINGRWFATDRKATEDEIKFILKTERETLVAMGLDSKQQVFLTGRWNEFKNTVNEILLKDANINYYYDAYNVITYEKGLEDNVEEMKIILNGLVVDRTLELIYDRYKKYSNDFGDTLDRRGKKEYLDNHIDLTKVLMKKSPDIDISVRIGEIKDRNKEDKEGE